MNKPQRYKNLIKEISKCKPYSILEIGTWNAVNACKMIEEAKKHHAAKHIHYYGFDLFEGMTPDIKENELHAKKNITESQARKNLNKTGIKYDLIVGNTHETLKYFEPEQYIDFIYIDGGHSLETIKNDWFGIQKAVYHKTVILFDDYYHNRLDVGCRQLVDNLDTDVWNVRVLRPIDKVNNLEISIAKVYLRFS
jgi:predicted O-methyltransferase YrrM